MTIPEIRAVLAPGYRLLDPLNLQIRTESQRVHSGDAEIGSPALFVINDQFFLRDPAGNIVLKFLFADPLKPEVSGNRLAMITVLSPRFSTAEGVRPESPIAETATIYGAPTLLDDDDEGMGREWVAFLNGPGGIRFEAGRSGGDGRRAGIYAPSESATSNYVPDSKIRAIVIGRR